MSEESLKLDYGKAIKQLREALGMARETVASRIRSSSGERTTASYLYEIEEGRKRPSSDTLVRIAHAFGLRPHEVLRFIEDPTGDALNRLTLVALERGTDMPRQHPSTVAQFLATRGYAAKPASVAMRQTTLPVWRNPSIKDFARLIEENERVVELLEALRDLKDEDVEVLLAMARRLLKKK